MKKRRILFLLLCLALLVGCGNNENMEVETNIDENNVVTNVNEMDVDEESDVESEEEVPGELVFSETVSLEPLIEIDEEKVQAAIALGFPDPSSELDVYYYTSKEDDVIQYSPMVNVFDLESNFEHHGFDGLKVVYEKTDYMWDDFFGDLDATEFQKTTTVILKGESIYEEEIEDEYAKYYRYYDENKGLYYEVQDLMIGNFMEEDAELTNEKYGQICNYEALDTISPPSHNPLLLMENEEFSLFLISELDGEPCIYFETTYNGSLYKRWVSLKDGILVKEQKFSDEGLLESEKIATEVAYEEVDASVFEEPRDVEYKDITMFIYSFEGGDLETLGSALENLLPDTETGILLTDEEGETVTLFASSIEDGMIEDVVYYFEYTLELGEVRAIRNVQADRFYTICDELEIVEIFDRSCSEKYFLDFENVGLLGVREEDDSKIYTFYNPNNFSVSGLYDVYEYVIENGVITKIVTYRIEGIEDGEAVNGVTNTYQISLIPFDVSMYDESCMDTYEILDHGEGSIDDGEHMPAWYQ